MTVSRQRDVGSGALSRLHWDLFDLHGMIGGVRGDVGDVFMVSVIFSRIDLSLSITPPKD
jgi:predicted sugar kinase